jgi:hypothetical protein
MSDTNFPAALQDVRMLLAEPEPVDRAWPALLAALAFAVCALALAGAVITAPAAELNNTPSLRPAN